MKITKVKKKVSIDKFLNGLTLITIMLLLYQHDCKQKLKIKHKNLRSKSNFDLNFKLNNYHASFLQTKTTIDKVTDIYDDPEYGDDLEGIVTPLLKIKENEKKKKDKKTTNLFSKIYEKINDAEIAANAANLMKDNEDTVKSYIKLNAIANLKGGKQKLKSNPALKQVLILLLNNPAASIKARTIAAKLSARINDVATTFQMTEPDQKNDPKDFNTYVALPRVKRLYTPDRYVENFKAGNWEPIF